MHGVVKDSSLPDKQFLLLRRSTWLTEHHVIIRHISNRHFQLVCDYYNVYILKQMGHNIPCSPKVSIYSLDLYGDCKIMYHYLLYHLETIRSNRSNTAIDNYFTSIVLIQII